MVELQKDTERLRKELHAAGVKNEEFKARIKHTEGVCQERQKEIDDLDKEIKEQVSKNTDINGLLESERGRTANLETQCRDNQNKVIEMEKEKSKLMQQFKIVMKMLSLGEEASIERESLQGSNDEPDSADARGTLITQHLSRMVSEKDNALQLVKELQVENQSLSKEVERLTEKTVHDSEDVSQKADLVIKTEKEIGDLQLKLDTMGKMLESKEKSLQTQSIERQRIEGQLQEAMNEKEKLEMDIRWLEKDKEISKQEKDGMDKKLGEQVEVISKLMADIELLKAQKQEAEEGRDSVLKQLDRERLTTRELEDTVEDLKRLQEETVSLEQVYEERKTKMTQEHADKVEFLTEQFQLLKEEQEKTSGERLHYQEQSEDFSKELDQVKERCEILETENKAVRDKNNDLNMEILRMQEEVELSKTERIEITDKLEQVSTETSKSLQETS
ncbi:myosin-11-like [Lytechinus variegatus]|uniref:myosin-11-like n=1 Tax=Lytechinus variegatus TaxID=7654 RepID=UPI001BB2398C|nr:myosin-11-like [Lytechinus variegatus]